MSAPEYSIVSWNILTPWPGDRKILPQSQRLDSFTTAVAEACPDNLSVVSLYEVEQDAKGSSNGLQVVEGMELPNHGTAENVKSNGYKEGLFMAAADGWSKPETVILDPNHDGQAALKTTHDNITVVGSILSYEVTKFKARQEQVAAMAGSVATEHSVLVGDWNGPGFFKHRRNLLKLGYTPMWASLGYRRPPITFPAPGYRFKTIRSYQQPFVGRGYSLDGAYVSPGLEVVRGGRLKGESDHYGAVIIVREKTNRQKNCA